ncbi:hypothetical protein VHEMI02107 [[Torrubiella] hemipterigena]|uniref:Uncharacterized protein n=1 Tax=[Torrubiella] hemipterigena TaxID=1531966 RepID=A0A0A1T9H2_9HYPO|nr:hypothetical protein VHEMI02107 [[Torrubiella] hemipterigena]
MPTVRYIDPRIEETAGYMPPPGRVYRGPVHSSQLHTLSLVEIEQLVRTLYFCRPADTQDAQERWLAFQKSRIRDLKVPLTRTRGIIQQVANTVSFYGIPFTSDHAHLCWTHKDLNAKLIRALTLLVAKECTQRVDGFRYWRRKGKLDDITDRWLTGIDNITTLWIGQDKASKVIKYYPTYRPPVLVDTSCEACKLAILGGTGNMLRDLRAGLLARSEYQDDLGSTDTQSPLLLDFVNAWLSTCYSSNRRRTLTIESEELVPVILSLRHGRRLRRQQKAEDRHRRGKHDLMYDQDYTESIQAPGREPLPYPSWDRVPSICLQPPAEDGRRVSRLEIEEAELAQHHPSFRMHASTPHADISSVAYWESRGQGKDFEDLMQRHSSDMDDDGVAISDLESLPSDLDDHRAGHRDGNDHDNMQGFPVEAESEEPWMSDYRKFVRSGFDEESQELLQPKTYVPPEVRSKQYFEDDDRITDDYSPSKAKVPLYDYYAEKQTSPRTRPPFEYPDYSTSEAKTPGYDYQAEEQISPRTRPQVGYPVSDNMPAEPVRADGSVFDYQVHETGSPSAYSTIVPGTRASVQSDDFRLPSPALPNTDRPSVFDYQVDYFSDEEPEEDDFAANRNNGNNYEDKPLPWVPGPKFSYYNTSSAYSTDPMLLPGRQSLEERPEVLSPIPVHPPSQTADVRQGWSKYSNEHDAEKVQNASPPSLCVTPVAPLALVLHPSRVRGSRAASHHSRARSPGGFVRSGAPSPEVMPPVQQSKVHATQDGYVGRNPHDSIKSMCASIAEVASCYSTMGWGGPQESEPNPDWVPVRRR